MIAKQSLVKALVFAQFFFSGSFLPATASKLSTIEFRAFDKPIVTYGSPMALRETYHTDMAMIGTFTAPDGFVICNMILRELVMMAGPTVPSFQLIMPYPNQISYSVANGTSRHNVGLGKQVNPKPTGKVILDLVPATGDRSACRKLGQVWSFRGPNTLPVFSPESGPKIDIRTR